MKVALLFMGLMGWECKKDNADLRIMELGEGGAGGAWTGRCSKTGDADTRTGERVRCS